MKNKALFSINVIGLAIGIATCLMITLFVMDELSYDHYNKKVDQIARIVLKAKMGDEIIDESSIPAPIARTLTEEFPEVLKFTRFRTTESAKVTYENKILRDGDFAFVDQDFFEIFTIPLIKGDPKKVLSEPNSVVLTKDQAYTYFGHDDPMGKTLKIESISFQSAEGSSYVDNDGIYTVTGIIDKIPENSHFHFDIMASMASNKDANNQVWIGGNYYTYLLLRENTNLRKFESKLSAVVKKYMGNQLEMALGMPFDDFIALDNKVGLYVEALSDVHFSNTESSLSPAGDPKQVYMFGVTAIFMLLIACINFMNLSTAGASKRIKEIGMRKVLGSNRKQLIKQFLFETLISTLIAMCIGVLLFALTLPQFNELSGKDFRFEQILTPRIMFVVAIITTIVSLLAGSYPAFFMSAFKPIQALKNTFTTNGGKSFRSGLVVFQFAISITLIIATLVVSLQMNFIQNKDVGYEREQLIVIRSAGRLGDDLAAYENQLKQDPRVKGITMSAYVPAGPTDQSLNLVHTNHEVSQTLRAKMYRIDENYIPTMGMEIVVGRNFSTEFGTEEENIIVNETAIKTFGLRPNPVGETLKVAADSKGNTKMVTVVGVVKDFHARSLHEPIEPLIMEFNPYYGLILRAKTSDYKGLIEGMKSRWEDFNSGEVFEYAFLDELYNETYLKEANMNTILRIFALLTIFVACLGLLGLVTFTARQRFKEIGIRKVLGSSVTQIVNMLAKDFLKLVTISMFVAFPIGYYLMNKWLEDFAYRIELKWWIFALSGLITLFIAFMTISYKSIRAARMNPVKSLRTE